MLPMEGGCRAEVAATELEVAEVTAGITVDEDVAEEHGWFRMSDKACRCWSEVRLYDLTPSTLL